MKINKIAIDSVSHGTARIEVSDEADNSEVKNVSAEELGKVLDVQEGQVFLIVNITKHADKPIKELYSELLRSACYERIGSKELTHCPECGDEFHIHQNCARCNPAF